MDKDSFARKKEVTKEDGTVMQIDIETTIGQEIDKNRPIPNNNYFNYTDGIVYVYDGSDQNSMQNTLQQYKMVQQQYGEKIAVFVNYNNKGLVDSSTNITEDLPLDSLQISRDEDEALNQVLDTFASKILDNKIINDSVTSGARSSNFKLQRNSSNPPQKKSCKC